jgi:hypothetical protein
VISRKTAIALGDVFEDRFTATLHEYKGNIKRVKEYRIYHDALYDFLFERDY